MRASTLDVLALMLLAVATAQPAAAAVIYQYTGPPYVAVSLPWGLGMSVNGTITLPAPLAPNLSCQILIADITSGGYSFTDGVNAYNQTNSVIEEGLFSTDASGAISQWYFIARLTSTQVAVETSANPCEGECDGVASGTAYLAFNNVNTGTWSGPMV